MDANRYHRGLAMAWASRNDQEMDGPTHADRLELLALAGESRTSVEPVLLAALIFEEPILPVVNASYEIDISRKKNEKQNSGFLSSCWNFRLFYTFGNPHLHTVLFPCKCHC